MLFQFRERCQLKNFKKDLFEREYARLIHSPTFRIFTVVFLASLFTFKPFGGAGSNGSVEQWMNLTNAMFAGPGNFIFSYGPLFWLTGGTATAFNIWTWLISLIYVAFNQAAFWTLIWKLRHSNTYLFMAIALGITVAAQGIFPNIALFFWPVLLLPQLMKIALSTSKQFSYLWLLLGLYVGFAFYVRFFYGALAAICIGGWLALVTLKSRQYKPFLGFCTSAFISFLTIGLLVFRDWSAIWNYLFFNQQLSFGNAVDMTYEVQTNWLIFLGIVILLSIVAWRLRHNLEIFLPVIAVEFILFKLGFGRADHVATYLIPTIPLLLLLAGTRGARSRWRTQIPVIALLGAVSIVPNYVGAPTLPVIKDMVSSQIPYEDRMSSIYPGFILEQEDRLLIGNSTVDVYPYANEIAFANKLNYTPRPLFQSYMTLTRPLGQANVEYLTSNHAPEFIVWAAGITCNSMDCNFFDGFDGKYLLNEDPLTSLAIIQNYRQVSMGHLNSGLPYAIFVKEQPNRLKKSQLLGVVSKAELGKWIKVPAVEGVYTQIVPELEITFLGNLKNSLFRGNSASITYKLSDGTERRHRLNVLNASSGVWVSPYLNKGNFAGEEVTDIMISAPTWYIEKQFNLEWRITPR
jgi:hypothetical protein